MVPYNSHLASRIPALLYICSAFSSQASNGEVQRGRERHSEVDERLAARPPLQRRGRQLRVRLRSSISSIPPHSSRSTPVPASLPAALASSALHPLLRL